MTEIAPIISSRTGSQKEQVSPSSLLAVDMDPQADVILGMPCLRAIGLAD